MSLMIPGRLRSSAVAPLQARRFLQRSLVNSSQRAATVAQQDPAAAASSSSSSQTSSSEAEDAAPLRPSIYGSKELLEAKKERKFAQYERLLSQKARQKGLESVAELRAEQERMRAEKAKMAIVSSKESAKDVTSTSGMTESDAKIASQIRKRAEAEAERKIKTGNFSSGPGIKPLADIIDMSKLAADSPAKISQLWTQYHTLKNKISAVIPAKQYADMAQKARQYPTFLLPLPRTIIGSLEGDQSDTANVAPGEAKQGYEMQYLQWSSLPPPPTLPFTVPKDEAPSLTAEERRHIEAAAPSTVLFTPLAEYKVRQEYAQPVLVLTHYTDLALSKGIVLLRGEVTGAEEAPTGIAAAVAAAQAGETSSEKLEQLQKPLQSQGKLSPQDAQLLTVTLQRYYMPKAEEADKSTIAGEQERQDLLHAFHHDQEKFDIDRLCTYSLLT